MRGQLVQQIEKQAAEEPLASALDALSDEALKVALNVAAELEGIEQNSATALDVRYAYLRDVSVALDACVTALTQAQAKAALRGYVERRRSTRLTVARVLPAK